MPRKGGAIIGDRYYTEHALARMAPKNNMEIMAILDQRMISEAVKDGVQFQTEEFLNWLNTGRGNSFRVNPRSIPPSVVEAEIMLPGSTGITVQINEFGDVISVIPK